MIFTISWYQSQTKPTPIMSHSSLLVVVLPLPATSPLSSFFISYLQQWHLKNLTGSPTSKRTSL